MGVGRALFQALSTAIRQDVTNSDIFRRPQLGPGSTQNYCNAQDGLGHDIVVLSQVGWTCTNPYSQRRSSHHRACKGNGHMVWDAANTTVWRAMRPGATMVAKIKSGFAVYVEMYHHHDRNMGSAIFTVGNQTTVVDTCCPTDCLGKSLPGQGFTFLKLVATNVYSESISIFAAPSNTSSCQSSNLPYQLDLFSIIVVDKPTWQTL